MMVYDSLKVVSSNEEWEKEFDKVLEDNGGYIWSDSEEKRSFIKDSLYYGLAPWEAAEELMYGNNFEIDEW